MYLELLMELIDAAWSAARPQSRALHADMGEEWRTNSHTSTAVKQPIACHITTRVNTTRKQSVGSV
jgi:hypothetical protein